MYVSFDDVFTFTNYKGLDPEIGNFGFRILSLVHLVQMVVLFKIFLQLIKLRKFS